MKSRIISLGLIASLVCLLPQVAEGTWLCEVQRYDRRESNLCVDKVGVFDAEEAGISLHQCLLRIRDEMDRRVILLSITQQGKKVLKFHDKFHDDILGQAYQRGNQPQTNDS